tara:strand:- start:129 stop:485 length:357 start_codon:yes stop_codon:yes gene_type:complete
MTTSKTRLTPLEKLKQAANLKPIKREVELTNGDIFEFWSTPLTMAERERASKGTKDDLNAFALQLFIQKATYETGERMFAAGQASELKHECRDADLQALMLALLSEDQYEEGDTDPKK